MSYIDFFHKFIHIRFHTYFYFTFKLLKNILQVVINLETHKFNPSIVAQNIVYRDLLQFSKYV